MSSSKGSPDNGASKKPKRALPSWMSARADAEDDEQVNDSAVDDSKVKGTAKKSRGGQVRGAKDESGDSRSGKKSSGAGSSSSDFSKLLDGVVIALSGFVNPERGILRSQALEMGAEYKQDWSSDCTLLVCAFRNTPKFRQVEADGGTIVSKDWITECYTKKKLVDIETYLMHIGKPWRKINSSLKESQAFETCQPSKSCKHEVKQPEPEPHASSSSKQLRDSASKHRGEDFSPSEVKRWAKDDLEKTLAWLESQDEKPEPSEIRNVAAEGILTCLQDTIDLIDNKQDLKKLTEQWNIVPHAVVEMIKAQGTATSSTSSKADLCKLALTCKQIYEMELKVKSDGSKIKEAKRQDKGKAKRDITRDKTSNSMDYDSDETIEMTQDEINDAYNCITSMIPES